MFRVPDDCQVPNLQAIYNQYFYEQGTFLEIGAYDGVTFSNTCFLADDGWKGIYIEPIEKYYLQCKERHKNNDCIVLQELIGQPEEKTLYIQDLWTTSCEDTRERGINGPFRLTYPEKVTMVAKPIYQVLSDINVSKLDLVVIDTEGTELEILREFPFETNPKMFIIEMHETVPGMWHTEEWVNEINHIMDSQGYKKIFSDSINTIFVK